MNNENIKGYSVKDIIDIVLRKLWFIIIVTVVMGAAAFSYSYFVMPLQYESHTSMYVKNNTASISDKDSVNLNDLNASKSLVSTYIAVLKDDAVMEEIGKSLVGKYGFDRISEMFAMEGEGVKPSSLRQVITMQAVDATEVLRITAITTDAEISSAICNDLSDIAPEFLIRVVGAGSVEAIGTAKINRVPVAPDVKKYALMGLVAGFIISVGIVFVLDFFDNTIKDSEELTKKYDKALIGEIQCIENGRKKKKKSGNNGGKKEPDERSFNLLTNKETPFYVVEAYKAMRTNLIFSLSTSDKKIFAVSSANPGDGKSTTSANIAIALSQLSNKVILIDGDMRKPVQHKIFKTKNVTGLSSVLGKMNSTRECIRQSGVENLDIMTAGPQPPNPSELLASSQMEKLIAELSEKYDYIIIDTPPVNVVTDAMSIGKYVSGILLVMRYGGTTFDEASNAIRKIEFAEMNMLGFVLNYVQRRHGTGSYYRSRYSRYKYYGKYGSYEYGYGYGYGYGENNKDNVKTDKSKDRHPELQTKSS